MKINSFDIDGVIYMGEYDGIYPGENDVIITGRSFEEKEETFSMLDSKNIYNEVFFNPLIFNKKTRKSSGIHKALTLLKLIREGKEIQLHFDDDPIQIKVINILAPKVKTVLVSHNLVEKENVRHNE